MTPDEQLRLYRTRHVISVIVRDPEALFFNKPTVPICKIDRIRVLQRLSGRRPLLWRHDPDEIKRLAAFGNGPLRTGASERQ